MGETASGEEQIPPPTRRDPLWFSPVFVLCPARSNSSVATAMLGQHPDICAFPELALFRRATLGAMLTDPPGWKGQPSRLRLAGFYRALAQLHNGVQTEVTVAAASEWVSARQSWRPADALDHLLELAAPRIGIEKSPENSSREEYLDRLATAYPRARFLHLTRHPVTSVASMYAVWHDKSYWSVSPELFHHFCVGIWYFQHRRIHEFTSSLPADRALQIRSEDVVNSPADTLPKICRWLGLDAPESALEAMLHPENSPYARIGPDGALGGADSGFLHAPKLHPAEEPPLVDLPAGWGVDPWLHLSVIELAHRLGYRSRR
jgi:hypothetical protein